MSYLSKNMQVKSQNYNIFSCKNHIFMNATKGDGAIFLTFSFISKMRIFAPSPFSLKYVF